MTQDDGYEIPVTATFDVDDGGDDGGYGVVKPMTAKKAKGKQTTHVAEDLYGSAGGGSVAAPPRRSTQASAGTKAAAKSATARARSATTSAKSPKVQALPQAPPSMESSFLAGLRK